jgi:hypothetical protein
MKLHKVSRSIRRLTLLAAITGGTIFQGNACLTQPAREALLLGLQETAAAARRSPRAAGASSAATDRRAAW